MINSIKQHHKLAVNFAVLGATTFVIATILLFFLWQNITTEKQITELADLMKAMFSKEELANMEASFNAFVELQNSGSNDNSNKDC